MLCEKCGKSVSVGASFCKYCGHNLGSKPKGSNNMFCKKCKTENPINSNFCKSCGSKLHSERSATAKSEITSKVRRRRRQVERVTCAHCHKDFTVEDLTKRDVKEGYTVECDHCGGKVEVEGEEIERRQSRTTYRHGLTEEQQKYLKRKKTAYNIVSGVGAAAGGVNMTAGVICLVVGILLSLTGILAIIGIPLIILAIILLAAGGAGAHGASKAGKKAEEIEDKLHGVER